MSNYELTTVVNYVKELETVNVLSLEEKEIEKQVERYLLNKKRAESNAKVIEALLG